MLSASQYSIALLLVAAAASTEAGMPTGDYHGAMLTAVNQERAKQGVPSLCMNKKLQAAAQRHSDDMAKNNFMAHDGHDGSTMSQRITEAGYEWDSVAENVAAGQEEVQSVMESWMTSEGHRLNIMNPDYTMFGTAFSYNKDSQYGIYWTQDFGSGGSEACDGGNTTVPAATPPTKQEIVTPAPTTVVPETPATVTPNKEIPATKGPVVTPAATTPAPVVTPAATTPAPVVTPAATTPAPVATPAATTPAPVATPAATTPAPVATPAATTPAPVATPAATTTPPSATQNDCESNF